MDELDQLLIGQTLEGGWVVQEPRHVQRDAPSASRAYLASYSQGTKAFVKARECVNPRQNVQHMSEPGVWNARLD